MGNSLGLLVFTKQSARLVDGVISDTDGESKPSRNVGLLVPAMAMYKSGGMSLTAQCNESCFEKCHVDPR
jgi:hypothetical protein